MRIRFWEPPAKISGGYEIAFETIDNRASQFNRLTD